MNEMNKCFYFIIHNLGFIGINKIDKASFHPYQLCVALRSLLLLDTHWRLSWAMNYPLNVIIFTKVELKYLCYQIVMQDNRNYPLPHTPLHLPCQCLIDLQEMKFAFRIADWQQRNLKDDLQIFPRDLFPTQKPQLCLLAVCK